MLELMREQYSILLDIQGLRSDLAYLEGKKLNVKLLEEKLDILEDIFSLFKQNDNKIKSKYGPATSGYGSYIETSILAFEIYRSIKDRLTKTHNYLQMEEGGFSENDELARYCMLKLFRDHQSHNSKDLNNDQMIICRSVRIMSSLERSLDQIIMENQTKEYYEVKIEHINKKWEEFQQQDIDHDKVGFNVELIENKVQDVLIKLKEELNKSRNQHIINSLERIVDEIILPHQKTEYYEVKMEHIYKKWEQFQKQNIDDYCKIRDPDKAEYNLKKITEIENKVQNVLIKLKEQLNKCEKISSIPMHHNNSKTANRRLSLDPSVLRKPINLIPKFDGDYNKWIQFKDSFTEIIDKHPINKVDKMHYLKNSLQDNAKILLKDLAISETNYDLAWKILNDKYDNKRLLVSNLIDKFISQPSITVATSKLMKQLYDSSQEFILSLENIGLKVNGVWDPILIQILNKKLDKETNVIYEKLLINPMEPQSLNGFLQFINTRHQVLEMLETKQENSKKNITKEDVDKQRSAAFNIDINTTKCPNCGSGHLINKCVLFLQLPPINRRNLVQKWKLCFNCLSSRHVANSCHSEGCTKCNEKHNILLHIEKLSSSNSPVNIMKTKGAKKKQI